MNHDSYTDDYIAGILGAYKRYAFVGASANTSRPSYFAMKYLLSKGYTVVPQVSGKGNRGIRDEAHLSDVFRKMHLSADEGTGLAAMRAAMHAAGLNPPLFDSDRSRNPAASPASATSSPPTWRPATPAASARSLPCRCPMSSVAS